MSILLHNTPPCQEKTCVNLNMDIELPPFKIEKIISSLSQSSGWGVKELNIPSIWKESTGKGVTIGVIDTGMPEHDDIGDNAIRGKSFIKVKDILTETDTKLIA